MNLSETSVPIPFTLSRIAFRSAERLGVLFCGVTAAPSPMAPTAPNLWRRPCSANSLACCGCRGIAGRGRVGADFRFRLGRPSRLHGGWHGGGWGWGGPRIAIGGPAYYGSGYGGCYVRRLVSTPWGPRWRLANRLLISIVPSPALTAPAPSCWGFFKVRPMEPGFIQTSARKAGNQPPGRRNNFCSRDLIQI